MKANLMLTLLLAFSLPDVRSETTNDSVPPWWTHSVIYEEYPRNFQASNGDDIADLRGITQRLAYLREFRVDAIWITPFFPSPNADLGYDIADCTSVSPEYGALADWDELVREADRRGIRTLVSLVLDHSSDQHPWFQESRSSRTNSRRDGYVWRDGRPDDRSPTNGTSALDGSIWRMAAVTGQYHYHVFLPGQPDLSWANSGARPAYRPARSIAGLAPLLQASPATVSPTSLDFGVAPYSVIVAALADG